MQCRKCDAIHVHVFILLQIFKERMALIKKWVGVLSIMLSLTVVHIHVDCAHEGVSDIRDS